MHVVNCAASTLLKREIRLSFLVPRRFVVSMPLSTSEAMQLKALLAKARSSEPGSPVADLEGFDLIHDDSVIAGMTDGSKRREDEPPADQPSVKRASPNALAGYGGPDSAAPWRSSDPVVSHQEFLKTQDSFALMDRQHVIKKAELPPEVPNAAAWGRTLIDFGKFRDAKLSYEELRCSKDTRAFEYTKWCRARAFSAEGLLRDFAQYLLFMNQLEALEVYSDGPFIPGTSTRRQYK